MRHQPVTSGRRRAVAFVAALLLVAPVSAAAEPRGSGDVAEELGETQRRADSLADELGRVQADIEDATERLARLALRLDDARGRLQAAEGQVALAEQALEEAEDGRADAEAAHRRAVDVLAATEEELGHEESVLADQIVQSFKYGTVGAKRGAMVLEVLRRAEDPNVFAVGMKQLRVVVDTQESTVQRVFDLRDRRADQAANAARARGAATQAAADAAQTLQVVEELREQAAALADEVRAAEEEQRVELAALESDAAQTATLLAGVDARRSELEAELADRRAAEEAERLAREAEQRETARRSGGGSGGGPAVDGGYCPVVGAVAGRDFSNDWGYPRSGGRAHEGNDIFARRGVPVVAIADGVVIRTNPADSQTSLGGITVTYRTGDGSEWYNAHLDTIAAGIVPGASVTAGEPIGTVGNTGNARTTPPHLHLGRRIGGSWVNPWPTVAPLCR